MTAARWSPRSEGKYIAIIISVIIVQARADFSDLKLQVVVLLARPCLLPELELIHEPLLLCLLYPLDALQHGGVFDCAVIEACVVGVGHPAVVEVGVCPGATDVTAAPDVRMWTQVFGKWTVRVLKRVLACGGNPTCLCLIACSAHL